MDELLQGTPEWLAQRVGKITASRFAEVLAYSSKTYVDNAENRKLGRAGVTVITELQARKDYKIQVALERIVGHSTPVFENYAMRTGTEREPKARQVYEHRNSVIVEQVGFVQHDDYQFAGGSPDGIIQMEVPGALCQGAIELKCPQLEQHFENLCAIEAGELPDKYRAQVQGIMWILGADWLDWSSFNPDFPPHLEFGCLRIERDSEYIATLEEEVVKFEAEVCALVERLMRMNGGPRPAPVRLKDLEYTDDREYAIISAQLEDPISFNDEFEPLSWLYTCSEIREGVALHYFERRSDGVTEAVRASDSWATENRLEA